MPHISWVYKSIKYCSCQTSFVLTISFVLCALNDIVFKYDLSLYNNKKTQTL